MANVLIVWELGHARGHVMMQRPVAQFFAAGGHNVHVALREMDAAQDAFGDVHAKIWQAPFRHTRVPPLTKTPLTFAHLLHSSGMVDGRELTARIEAWRTLFECVRPDLIVFDHSPTALLASRGFPAKRVIYGTGFYSLPPVHPLPNLRPWVKADAEMLLAHEAMVLAAMNRQLAQHGQPLLKRIADLYSEVDANFLAFVPELDHFGPRPVRYWGHRSETEGEQREWPAGQGPRIFGYLKKNRSLPELLNAVRESGHPSLMYGDWVDDVARSRFECSTLRLLDTPVNLPTAAREADLGILHATATSTFTFLIAGKPTFLLPLHLENLITARKVTKLGAASIANPRDPESVKRKLAAMLQNLPRYLSRARTIAGRYSQVNWDRLHRTMLHEMNQLLPPAS